MRKEGGSRLHHFDVFRIFIVKLRQIDHQACHKILTGGLRCGRQSSGEPDRHGGSLLGDVLFIEKLDVNAGDTVKFDKVLAILDGDNATFGAPTVEGASVDATVVKNGKGKKIRIFKYTPEKGYRKRQGHRQPYTKVQIGAIKA